MRNKKAKQLRREFKQGITPEKDYGEETRKVKYKTPDGKQERYQDLNLTTNN